MNATGLSSAPLIESDLSSRPLPPTSAIARLTAAQHKTLLVLEASLFWTLVLLIASLLWLGSLLFEPIETLIHPRGLALSSRNPSRDPMGAGISLTLILVLALITAGIAALAYEWCHAQKVKARRGAFGLRHHATYLAQSAVAHGTSPRIEAPSRPDRGHPFSRRSSA